MNNNKKFVPVMLMPFKEDLSIDYDVLGQLVDFYLESGARGLFANCQSSEMYHLSVEEMVESVRYIVQRVDGRVPIVATGSFGDTIAEQAENVKKIYETGVSAIILITGLLAKEEDSEEVFRSNVLRLLDLTGNIPVGFYECPMPYKRIISPALLGELVETGRVKYHKDTCLDIVSVRQKIAATEAEPTFGLYDAYMVHAVESLKAGSAGLSCIQGNYFPELVVWLCDNYANQGKQADVAKVQEFFTNNMDVMHDTYPASAKYILEQRGLDIGLACRNGSVLPNEDTKKQLDLLRQDFVNLSNEINLAVK
ncbi:dihydrodipicolinate synthase family protein [Sphingobacterium chuzhouense]|uniref:Dihydrodipicolinate synthase family protein n=1 Tax=Sphingobacterium chuzhouense TaxID=1742264 RepID=A0ABR7XP36_9SPHI|nr:dihydrodipicolinate synthase family protein [Sphingobacterium chuzhouense]MBD1420939.1 dihydrodipicolinate synthase family protein [Sphingobacterium chuzhouense]